MFLFSITPHFFWLFLKVRGKVIKNKTFRQRKFQMGLHGQGQKFSNFSVHNHLETLLKICISVLHSLRFLRQWVRNRIQESIFCKIWTFVGKVMSLLFNSLSKFAIGFLPRSKCLLISWLQSPSAVILEPKKMKSVTCQGKNTEVVCYSLLQWTTLCQNSSLCPICLGWPCMAWLMASLNYASPFATTRL